MTPRLLTIRFSHYNEFARWSLQYSKVKFVEYAYAPVQHILPLLLLTYRATQKIFFSESSIYKPKKDKNSPTGTPVMILETGQVLSDSWAIAEYAFTIRNHGHKLTLNPSLIRLVQILNDDVGPCVRQITYSHVLKPNNHNVFLGLCTDGTHQLYCTDRWVHGFILYSHALYNVLFDDTMEYS